MLRRLLITLALLTCALPAHQADAARFVYANRVAQVTATAGQGTITLGAAVAGNATAAEAGVPDGSRVTYVITNGGDFEVGTGTYTAAGTTLSRDTVYLSKIAGSAGTTKLTLVGTSTAWLTPSAADLNPAIIDPSFAHATQGGI